MDLTTNNQFVSPVFKLPLEITADIFEACLPEITWPPEGPASRYKTVPNAAIPLVIGKVCCAWRNLAWSTPRLWSGISLLLEYSTPIDCELLKEWLLRSGDSLLSIHLRYDRDGLTAGDATRSILRAIADCSERWRDVYFAFPASFYNHFDSIRSRLPCLTSLSLSLRILDVRERGFQHFSIAPRLCHVELHGYNRELMNIPLHQVTKLSLNIVDAAHCIETLRCFPDLAHCSFKYMFLGRERLPFPFLASHVKYLEFVVNDKEFLSSFLDSLALPDVQELRIDMRRAQLPHSSLISLVARSGCLLQRFTLAKCSCDSAELQALFSAIPTLVQLEVNNCAIPGSAILQLLDLSISDHGSTALLPNLQSLKLVNQLQVGIDVSELASLVLSRRRNGTTKNSRVALLLSIELLFDRFDMSVFLANIDLEVVTLLRQLIMDGLEIIVRDGNTVNPYRGELCRSLKRSCILVDFSSGESREQWLSICREDM